MFEYPLIRFDNRKWLEKLQEGQLYMRPSIFYQQLEDDGEVRSDPYDGSIPLADEKRIMERISGKETFRERIVLFNRYVKCFYHCSKENLIYSNGIVKVAFSSSAVKTIQGFNTDSAMIIFSPSALIKQISERATDMIWHGNVQYLDEDGYAKALYSLNRDLSKTNMIPFYKSAKYSAQQEYRICVQHPFDKMDEKKPWLDISKDIVNSLSYTMDIGPIEGSCIVNVNNLLQNGILYDTKRDHYYLAEESK